MTSKAQLKDPRTGKFFINSTLSKNSSYSSECRIDGLLHFCDRLMARMCSESVRRGIVEHLPRDEMMSFLRDFKAELRADGRDGPTPTHATETDALLG
jgi:hypothetical protein